MKNFKNEWTIWIYDKANDWSRDNLKKVKSIKTIDDFIKLDKNLRNNCQNILNKHIFIMKNEILPLWEEKENINGGCWTFKSSIYDSLDHFLHIFLLLITNNFLSNELNNDINGITYCPKNNNICIIQVWNNNFEKLSNIKHHFYIRETYQYNIIYKKHIR